MVVYLGISSAIVNPALVFAPLLVGGMVIALDFSTTAAVTVLSLELAATALAFVPALWWANSLPLKRVAVLALLGMTVGNLLSVGCDSVVSLAPVRALTGLFEGTLLIVIMLVTAQVKQTEQVFGGKLVFQMLAAIVGLALLPFIIAESGMLGVYGMLAVLTGCLLLGVRFLPKADERRPSAATDRQQMNKPTLWGYLSLLLLLMFAAGTNVVWTHLERIGSANDLTLETVGLILACSIFIAILSGLFCAQIGLKYGRLIPISTGLLVGIVGCLLLKSEFVNVLYFTCGAFFMAIAKVLPLPYLFGCLAELDKGKTLTIFSHVVMSLGMACGPLLGVLFSENLSYKNVLVCGLFLLTLTWLMAVKLDAVATKNVV